MKSIALVALALGSLVASGAADQENCGCKAVNGGVTTQYKEETVAVPAIERLHRLAGTVTDAGGRPMAGVLVDPLCQPR